jgi:hypothetical protein
MPRDNKCRIKERRKEEEAGREGERENGEMGGIDRKE